MTVDSSVLAEKEQRALSWWRSCEGTLGAHHKLCGGGVREGQSVERHCLAHLHLRSLQEERDGGDWDKAVKRTYYNPSRTDDRSWGVGWGELATPPGVKEEGRGEAGGSVQLPCVVLSEGKQGRRTCTGSVSPVSCWVAGTVFSARGLGLYIWSEGSCR